MKKPSFLERLTGSVPMDDYEEVLEEDVPFANDDEYEVDAEEEDEYEDDYGPQEGQLPVDMYVTGDSVVIRALVAGVSPADLDIAITRDMVTIKGHRDEEQEAPDDDYIHRELFWGGFSRTITLPEEVMIDEAEAREQHGMLEIRLPKVDKHRSARLKVSPKVSK